MRIAKLFGVVSVAALAAVSFTRRAEAATVVKIGTLAPAASPVGKVLKVWAESVSAKTGGAVELQLFYGGTQGDEPEIVTKMNAGTLDGAILTGTGLGKIYKPIQALEMPGAFSSLAKFESTRETFSIENDKGLNGAGYTNLGWFTAGTVRPFAKGFALHNPDDFKGRKPFALHNDDIDTAFFHSIAGVTPVVRDLFNVLQGLVSTTIDSVESTSLDLEQMNWSPRLDNATDLAVAYRIGAIVLASKRFTTMMPATNKTAIFDGGTTAAQSLRKTLRGEDDAAWGRLKAKMTVTVPSAADLTKWQSVWQQTRSHLVPGTFTAALVTKIETLGK